MQSKSPKVTNESHWKRKGKENDSSLQSFYIGVLNKFYDIRIEKPKLNKMKEYPFFRIISITTENDEIPLAEYIDNRCNEIYDSDLLNGIQISSVERRFEKNLIKETLNILLDAIEMKNYLVHSSKGKTHVDKNIFYIKDFFHTKQILDKGQEINSFICSLFNNDDDILLSRNDFTIQQILGF
ncbi:hypothetical protein EDI_113220 [Entamoeba dispar SAW760]|uniref:Uncharacterized protein n=1 Tax=Entamoeba dispar (strain ATCC PRA-260 / SAW760) TaxID=370354 RepID=B0E5W9_ENTDS|nr:uncharacterized protein EDI_113220 [Entamoeba dispar SAW760]EDR30087.1 hypothetical protein EDI_113220 [Entamoeba dispar SAW760]|eukprot:EDR30087.1 hypothetical protein EDI_113220 [Entamoeba dispar SAW760]